jgi:hypothetical protein
MRMVFDERVVRMANFIKHAGFDGEVEGVRKNPVGNSLRG